jgi:hypothetical protein
MLLFRVDRTGDRTSGKDEQTPTAKCIGVHIRCHRLGHDSEAELENAEKQLTWAIRAEFVTGFNGAGIRVVADSTYGRASDALEVAGLSTGERQSP